LIRNSQLVKLDQNGCMGPNDCGLNVGVKEPASQPHQVNITVFPNPASEYANFYIKGISPLWATKPVQIALRDLFGRQVYVATHLLNQYGYAEARIEVCGLPPGVYVYSVTGNGGQLGTGKLMVD